MKKGDSVVIEKTANGWIVRPEFGEYRVLMTGDIQVFQHLQYDWAGVQSEHCVCGFLTAHFTE